MERQRNWLVWLALGLAGVALLVALGGRFGGQRFGFGVPAVAVTAPEAPRFADERELRRGPGGPPAFADEIRRGDGDRAFHGRGFDGPGFGHRHGFNPLGMIFGLVNFLTKLAALGLLAWLLLRLFQQRRNEAPPAAPTTPAGHDPRVE